MAALRRAPWTRCGRPASWGWCCCSIPPGCTPASEGKDQILKAKERLPGDRLAVEFRHHSWLDDKHRDDTLRFLRDNGLAFVCVDEPQGFASSVPPMAEATADVAYVRFHGRNHATWEAKGLTAAERFDWYYTPEEMGGVGAAHRESRSSETRAVHALMNTNRGDQGPVNARLLASLLQIPLRADARRH